MFTNHPAIGPFFIQVDTDVIYVECVGALSILTNFPSNGEREYIQGVLQNLMVKGNVGSPGGPEVRLLERFTTLKNLKLEVQGAASESGPGSDMGGSWSKILTKRLRKENKVLSVQFLKRSEMAKEVAEKIEDA
jgi:hypothetical protein